MPLFSSKHKNDKANTHGSHLNNDMYSGSNNTAGTGTNTFNPHPSSGPGGGGGYNQGATTAGAHDPYGASTNTMGTGPGIHGGAGGMTGPHGAAGVGPNEGQWFGSGQEFSSNAATYGGSGGTGTNIPPSNAINHGGTTGTGGGTATRMTGKVESAMGTMLGSSALKAKGLQKEQEVNSVKLQGSELAEAERLEREALMRRERAVAHGAHPANGALGAGHYDRQQQPQGGW